MDKNTSSFDAAGNVSYLPVLPSACPPRLAGLISDDESANSYFTISLGAPWAPTSRPPARTPRTPDLEPPSHFVHLHVGHLVHLHVGHLGNHHVGHLVGRHGTPPCQPPRRPKIQNLSPRRKKNTEKYKKNY